MIKKIYTLTRSFGPLIELDSGDVIALSHTSAMMNWHKFEEELAEVDIDESLVDATRPGRVASNLLSAASFNSEAAPAPVPFSVWVRGSLAQKPLEMKGN